MGAEEALFLTGFFAHKVYPPSLSRDLISLFLLLFFFFFYVFVPTHFAAGLASLSEAAREWLFFR